MVSKVVHSSKTDEYSTPSDVFTFLDDIFHFTLDVCASPENAKCKRYFTKEDNGLAQSWKGEMCFMNPPYSETDTWMEKAFNEYLGGSQVICLPASRTDTAWFRGWAAKGLIIFWPGRIGFSSPHDPLFPPPKQSGAPFPSAAVCFIDNIRDFFDPFFESEIHGMRIIPLHAIALEKTDSWRGHKRRRK
jgi:phage N-6-adenine-methyltransferase